MRLFIKKHLSFIFLLLLILPITNCATEPAQPEKITNGDFSFANTFLDWIVKRNMARDNIPGCAIAVVDRERVIFQQEYGVADSRTKKPVTAEMFFRAGSITKSLTALAVMKLSEQGKIDIERPVTDYVPEFSLKNRTPGAPPITIRMLLSHRSGIMGDYLAGIMGTNRLSPGELLAALKNEYVSFQPGEAFLYSNTGYSILGMVIERVSGVKYEEYVKREILVPLGMAESSLSRTPFIEERLASGHMARGIALFPSGARENAPVAFLDIRDSAAGSLLTNIEEMSRYIQFFLRDKDTLSPRIISNRSFEEMQKVQFPEAKKKLFITSDYGLGLMRNTFNYTGVDDCIHHPGDVNGFYSLMLFSPKYGIGLILLSNSSGGFFSIYEIVSRSFKHYLETVMGRKLGNTLPLEKEGYSVSREQLRKYEGRYAVLGLSIDIRAQREELMFSTPSVKTELLLSPVGENRFKPFARALGIFYVDVASYLHLDKAYASFIVADDQVSFLTLEGISGDVMTRLALARVPKADIPRSFDRSLGSYSLVADERTQEALEIYLPVKEFRLVKKDGWLTLVSSGLPVELGLTLEPVSDTEALLAGSNETLQFQDDTITVSGLRIKKR
jgi:CubicO group peptidase (beta-lactamase class C family)